MNRSAMVWCHFASHAAIWFAVGGTHAQPTPPATLNLESAYAPVKAEMLAGRGSIVCMGDSLTFRDNAFWENFKFLIQARYGDGGWGYQSMSIWTGAFNGSEGWTQGVISSDTPPHYAIDGLWLESQPATTGGISIACRGQRVRFHYARFPGAGSFTVTPEGRAPELRQGASLANGLGIFDYTFGTFDVRRLRFEPQGNGSILLLGAETLSGQPGPVVHRAGNGGWGVASFLQRHWTFDAQLEALNPNMIIIMLGANDSDVEAALWASQMNQMIDRVQTAAPDSTIVLVSTYSLTSEGLPDHAQSLRQIATQRELGFIDITTFGGNYDYWWNNGLLISDRVHFSVKGGRHIARLVFDALETSGTSFANAPCQDIDFNNDASIFDPNDLRDFLAVYSEAPCPTVDCDPIDFNRDASLFDPADIRAFLSVYSEGPCDVPAPPVFPAPNHALPGPE